MRRLLLPCLFAAGLGWGALSTTSVAPSGVQPDNNSKLAIALAQTGEAPPAYQRLKETIHGAEGYDPAEFTAEVQKIRMQGLVLSTFRGFGLVESYGSRYISTDRFGRRMVPNQPANADRLKGIGFFGGSTAFSMGTGDKDAIPALMQEALNQRKAEVPVFNYGVPGYWSTQEMSYFIEAVRMQPMAMAIFYDGTNEWANYSAKLQSGTRLEQFDAMGYPFNFGLSRAVANIPGVPDAVKADVGQRHKHLPPSEKSKLSVNEMLTAENVESHARKVMDLYLQNVRDIAAIARAHGVTPVFVWQPDIYSTHKPLTEDEAWIKHQFPGHERLALAVNRQMEAAVKAGAFKDVTFIDARRALDGLPAEATFFDFCHLSRKGNQAVAAYIMAELDK